MIPLIMNSTKDIAFSLAMTYTQLFKGVKLAAHIQCLPENIDFHPVPK